MSSETTMSREEKEALLSARMEQIRKKNSELQKRYEEVQKDKQNAEAVSETFQESRRGAPPRETVTRPRPIKQQEHRQQRTLASYPKRSEAQRSSEPLETTNKQRSQRLKEDDGPPPDPSYKFLADKSREREDDDVKEQPQHDRNQGSRRHQGNYGGRDFDNVKVSIEKRRSYEKASPRHPPRNKMEMTLCMTGRERKEYERWRSERNRIEEDRVNRQRTSSGEWRREWDREKDNETKETVSPWIGSHGRGEDRDRSTKGRGRGSQSEFYSLRERGGERLNWRLEHGKDTRHETSDDDARVARKVEVNGTESLNISISNDITPERSNLRDSVSSQPENDRKQEERQPQSTIYWHADMVERDNCVPLRTVAVLDDETKGADASAQSLRVVVNLESVKGGFDGNTENDDVWEDDGAGSWEDCTTSGNESLVLSEHSQEEFVDCHLMARDAEHNIGTAATTILRESELPQSNCHDKTNRESREATPIVERCFDHLEIVHDSVDKEQLLETTQLAADLIKHVPVVEETKQSGEPEKPVAASPAVKTGPTASDVATELSEPTSVPQLQPADMATVSEEPNSENTEKEEEY